MPGYRKKGIPADIGDGAQKCDLNGPLSCKSILTKRVGTLEIKIETGCAIPIPAYDNWKKGEGRYRNKDAHPKCVLKNI